MQGEILELMAKNGKVHIRINFRSNRYDWFIFVLKHFLRHRHILGRLAHYSILFYPVTHARLYLSEYVSAFNLRLDLHLAIGYVLLSPQYRLADPASFQLLLY